MSQTLLLLKVLLGDDLRSRSVFASQTTYATLSLNAEVEVRSSLVRRGGSHPEWNQLFIFQVGPWWRGKEVILQVFAKNRFLTDAFIGGVAFTMGELVRACGLEEEEHGNGGGGGSGGPNGSTPGSSQNQARIPLTPTPASASSSSSSASSNKSSTPTQRFSRPSLDEVRSFGELLPILPQFTTSEEEPGGSGFIEHTQRHQRAASQANGNIHARSNGVVASSSSSSSSSWSWSGLPVTWLHLHHGGGPSKLKQFPIPSWSLPAGRVALYFDFIVLPTKPNPIGVQPSPISTTTYDVLPKRWNVMSDNEKLAWAARHRLERSSLASRPTVGGIVGFVASQFGSPASVSPSTPASRRGSSFLLGSGSQSPSTGRFPIYGRRPSVQIQSSIAGGAPSAAAGTGAAGVVSTILAWPYSILTRMKESFHRKGGYQDRTFYSWFFVLGVCTIMTEIFFEKHIDPNSQLHSDEILADDGGGVDDATFSLLSYLPFTLPSLTPFLPILFGLLILKFGWNMVHDVQLSHPWRRLDLVLTLGIGIGLGWVEANCIIGTTQAKALLMFALSTTHAYTRAALYGAEVVTGVVAAQYAPNMIGPDSSITSIIASFFAGVHYNDNNNDPNNSSRSSSSSPSSSSAPSVVVLQSPTPTIPVRPLFPHSLLLWTGSSLGTAYTTGVQWVTGSHANKPLPGSLDLTLRSALMVFGQIVSNLTLGPRDPVPISWSGVVWLTAPLAGFLVLFMFASSYQTPGAAGGAVEGRPAGRIAAQQKMNGPATLLRGKPWLILLAITTMGFLYALVCYVPSLLLWFFFLFVRTLWSVNWSLLGLPLEYLLASFFLPIDTFRHAAAMQVPGLPRMKHTGEMAKVITDYIPKVEQKQQQQQQQHRNGIQPQSMSQHEGRIASHAPSPRRESVRL